MNPLPPGNSRGPLVFISACEPSADMHAAGLIRAVGKLRPEVRFMGVAGPAMRAAGCDGIFDMTAHSAMLLGAVRAVAPACKLLAATKRHLREQPFAAAVVVDSPTLNLRIARQAKRCGIPVLYFIAPQLWAWGAFRIRRVRRRVDRMAVILPFEEEYFRDRHVDATYVGHPLFDSLAQRPPSSDGVTSIRKQGGPVVALLPGSRLHVVQEVLPGQLELAGRILARFPDAHVGVSVANPVVRAAVESHVAASGLPIAAYQDRNDDLLTAADLALVASGTATLEVAYRHTPMIVMYNASRWAYRLIGRWLIRTRHLSLVNILAGRELVPEFMPYYTSTRPIADRAIALLCDPEARRSMSNQLAALIDPLVKTGAPENTAQILLQMIDNAG
ncbi:MAG TPA: lipid-A-disaccharide synthase [Phycisphaerae bacterium]|nr:lipid-A-disaccharide synthase [Phycisphaerae bacterium]